MIKRNKYIHAGLYALIISAAAACRTPQPLALPAPVQVPEVTDTTAVVARPWEQLFRDPDLQSLIDTAIHRNYDLLMAGQQTDAAGAALLAARFAWLPSLNLSLSAGMDHWGDHTLNGVGNFDTNLSPNISKDQRIPTPVTPDYFAGIRSSWEIDLWGKIKSRKEAAYARFLASQEGRRFVATQLVAVIAGMYYELLALDNELAIIRRNIELQEAAVATVTIQKAGGRATELAVQQFTAQLLATRSLEYQVKQQINGIENELNGLLGRFPQPVPRHTSLSDQALPEVVAAGVPSQRLLQRPDIRQSELELRAAKADVKAARAAFLPSLTITPYAGLNAFSISTLFNAGSLAYGVLGGITGPIFNNKQLTAQHQLAKSQAMTAFYGYQKNIITGWQEVVTALNKVENQQQVHTLKSNEVMVLKDAVSTSRTMFTTGYATYLEVITAQKSVLEAELALVNTRKQIFLGVISLYRALGGG